MKVYIVTRESFPYGMAATSRIICYAKALIDGGMECEVIICRPTEIPENSPQNLIPKGEFEGIPFFYPGGNTIRSTYKPLRPFIDSLSIRRTEKYLSSRLKKGDVVFLFMGGKVELMLRFMNVAKKKEAFCVRDLCELPYVTGGENERSIRLRKETLERQFPKLDGIISISDGLFNLARCYAQPSCHHLKVPIMVDYQCYEKLERGVVVSQPYIFHAGTLSQQKDGIIGMIEAFGLAKQRLSLPVKFILTGKIEDSSNPEALKRIIKEYNLESDVEFIGYVYHNQIPDYLSKASLVISNRPRSRQDFYGFSTKMGEYLSSGVPVITTKWGEVANWLRDGDSAYIVEPEDTEALADAIVKVFTNPEQAERIGMEGRELSRKSFDYRSWSRPLVDFMYNLGK